LAENRLFQALTAVPLFGHAAQNIKKTLRRPVLDTGLGFSCTVSLGAVPDMQDQWYLAISGWKPDRG